MSESMAKYPRALPHRPPVEETDLLEAKRERSRAEPRLSAADLAALESRMRLRLFLVILSSAAILIVMGLIGVFYVNQAVRRAGSGAAPPLERPTMVKQEASRPELAASSAAIPAACNDRTAEVLGGLTAANLHQTYLNIGLLADAAENDVYSAEEARKVLETVLALVDSVDQQLGKVPEALLDASDQKKLARARQVASLLRTEAKRLQAYWDTPETDKAKKMEREAEFHQVRKAAWEGIKELLQLDD